MFKRRFYIFMAALLTVLFEMQSSAVTLAVLELTSNGTSNLVGYAVTDVVRSEFVNIGNFTVVERTRIRSILEEHGLQMTGCTDESCAVGIGKILSAEKLIVGEVNSPGNGIIITIRYIDIRTGVSMFSATGKAADMDEVIEAAGSTARDLIKKIVAGDKEILTPVIPEVYYAVSFIPGCGQIYAGERMKGWVFLGSFLVTGALTVFTMINYDNKRDEYRSLGELPAGSGEYDKKYKAAEQAGYYAIGSALLCSLVYAASWIDVLFITKPVFRKVKEEPHAGSVKTDLRLFSSEHPSKEANIEIGFRKGF